ncbi:MAG: ATPase, T2SS/T4P/T4SS family [Bdellovibrionota bacterium]|nr:MAG: ATPase, T2SS/T4P/T4SS family [Bdellovibrionota bacterium]
MRRIGNSTLLELPMARRESPSPQRGEVVGRVLTPTLELILEDLQREEQSSSEAGSRSHEELLQAISKSATKLGLDITNIERDEVAAVVERNQKPFGILQPLVDDSSVSDIIVTDFSRVSIQQGRHNFVTNIAFPNQAAYEAFVEKLLMRAGSSYSTKKPIADGMIGTSARIHAVHKCLCEAGPYLTIRLNRFSRVTVEDLCRHGMAPVEVFSYLQGLVRSGCTVLVVGEVGTGKTTLVRALAGSIPEPQSILVIEDTPEIKVELPHVRYIRTREENTDGAGRVTPSECIRAGMRMAMNRIIFGEMRDAEAAEAFVDVCASGHPGLSTIHARSVPEALVRLELFLGRAQRGVERRVIAEQIVTAVQTVVYVDICHTTRQRRIMEVREIGPVADGGIRHREMFSYRLQQGTPTWQVVSKVSAYRDLIESGDAPCMLSALPAVLHLGEDRVPMRSSREAVW